MNIDINFSDLATDILEWLSTTGLTIGLILITVELVNRFTKIAIGRAIGRALKSRNFPTKRDREQRLDTLTGILSATTRIIVWVIGLLWILSELGVNLAALAAGAGVAGLAIGFGAQSIISDFISGVFIILENQYRVGDVVELNGVRGTVQEVTVRSTVLRDLDGNVHHIPNGEVKISTNKTMGFSRVNIDVGVGYDSDIDTVEKVINEVGKELAKDKKLSEFIIEAPEFRRVSEFGDSAIEIKVVGKVMAGKQWRVAGEFRKRLKKAFDKNKIEIPFPQRVIHQAKK